MMKKSGPSSQLPCAVARETFQRYQRFGQTQQLVYGVPIRVSICWRPGKTGMENLQFVTFLVNVLMAVYKHNDLLKSLYLLGYQCSPSGRQ